MRRWLLGTIVLIILAASAFVAHVRRDTARRKREADFQALLAEHLRNLRPGMMKRRGAEQYLQDKHLPFEQESSGGTNGVADLIRIPREDHPWYCSAWLVSVEAEFLRADPSPGPHDSDVLQSIRVTSKGDGCL